MAFMGCLPDSLWIHSINISPWTSNVDIDGGVLTVNFFFEAGGKHKDLDKCLDLLITQEHIWFKFYYITRGASFAYHGLCQFSSLALSNPVDGIIAGTLETKLANYTRHELPNNFVYPYRK